MKLGLQLLLSLSFNSALPLSISKLTSSNELCCKSKSQFDNCEARTIKCVTCNNCFEEQNKHSIICRNPWLYLKASIKIALKIAGNAQIVIEILAFVESLMHLRWTAQSRVYRMTERSLWLVKSQLFHHLDLNSSVWLVFSAPPNPGAMLIWHPAVRHTRYYPQGNVTLKRIYLIAGWSHPTPPILPSALTSLLFLSLCRSPEFSRALSAVWIRSLTALQPDWLRLSSVFLVCMKMSSHCVAISHWSLSSGVAATPITDRCLKSSSEAGNLRGQTFSAANCDCIVKRKSLRPLSLSVSICGPSCSHECHIINTSRHLSVAFFGGFGM